MTGVVCLQGGAEFGEACREMDLELLSRAGGGRVVLAALAGAPGVEYDTANERGARYYAELGAIDVVVAPDVRSDPDGAFAAIRGARLLVLPGGSPARLLEALRESGLDEAIRELLVGGAVVSGASAGAMVLGAWTLLPEDGTPRLVDGLGVVPRSLVLPHYRGDAGWLDVVRDEVPGDVTVLGLPECAGVVVEGPGRASATAIGAAACRLLGARDEVLPLGASVAL